jgi:hypothetical protein
MRGRKARQRERRQRKLWQEAAAEADPAKVARMMAHVDAQAAALPDRGVPGRTFHSSEIADPGEVAGE